MTTPPKAARPLAELEPRHEFFIGIDSDGCAFDTMEIKQKECFCPAFVKAFGLQAEMNYSGVPMGTTIMSTDARRQRESAEELNLVQSIRKEMERAGVTKRSRVRVTEQGVSVERVACVDDVDGGLGSGIVDFEKWEARPTQKGPPSAGGCRQTGRRALALGDATFIEKEMGGRQ